MSEIIPIARSPLAEWSRRAGAAFETHNGWQVAVSYPPGTSGANTLVDRSHLATFEINGPETGAVVAALCGMDVPLRRIHSDGSGRDVYRLSPSRAIIVGGSAIESAIDVTGGWGTISLVGPDAEHILNKVTAVDLRERTLPVGGCSQGPVFGVNTLFGRFADRFDLHVCTDSAEFFWEVLLDAGAEFGVRPAATEDGR